MFGDLLRLYRLEVICTLSLLLIIYLGIDPMSQRFEALGILVKYKDIMEKQTGRKIKELQIGNVERYKN